MGDVKEVSISDKKKIEKNPQLIAKSPDELSRTHKGAHVEAPTIPPSTLTYAEPPKIERVGKITLSSDTVATPMPQKASAIAKASGMKKKKEEGGSEVAKADEKNQK